MAKRATGIRCLIVPGLFDSGPDHWQTYWTAGRPDCRRAELGDWASPNLWDWVARLDDAIAERTEPTILVGHSLGCIAIAWWALRAGKTRVSRIAGALLVAPPDVDRPHAHPLIRPFAPTPLRPFPFPSLLVASRDDPYASFGRLKALAEEWGSTFHDAGHQGHINAESGLGDWPEGQRLLDRLIVDAVTGRRPAPRNAATGQALPPARAATPDKPGRWRR